jgi:hypothetical protein
LEGGNYHLHHGGLNSRQFLFPFKHNNFHFIF